MFLFINQEVNLSYLTQRDARRIISAVSELCQCEKDYVKSRSTRNGEKVRNQHKKVNMLIMSFTSNRGIKNELS